MLLVSLDCSFLIAPSAFSNIYLEVFHTDGNQGHGIGQALKCGRIEPN